MALSLLEWFGSDLGEHNAVVDAARINSACPFIGVTCDKPKVDGIPSGACSVVTPSGERVVICPNRMYADNYRVLSDVARIAFGADVRVIHPDAAAQHDGNEVVAFGHRFGRELRLPGVRGRRGYFVDWILAHLNRDGALEDFVALEIQTIDTTGNYGDAIRALR